MYRGPPLIDQPVGMRNPSNKLDQAIIRHVLEAALAWIDR